jgi:hypothetical protein
MPSDQDFDAILARLKNTSQPVPMTSLYHLSDLSGQEQTALEGLWSELGTERRQHIIQNLHEIGEANFEVSFDSVFRLGLEDESPEVRATSIRALWESEDPQLMAPLIEFMQHDTDPVVRAAAASALGRYVYLGELEELPAAHTRRVEDALLEVINGAEELEVRRRALEALAYSSTRPEVEPLIAAAYASPDLKMRVSAMFAMGRTANLHWKQPVLAELESVEPELRFEAARAAGELELLDAGPELAELTADVDTQVREAAIWSLGQIGGDFARQALTDLLEPAVDEDEKDFIEEALENLSFSDEVKAFSMFEYDPAEDDLDLDLDDAEAEDEAADEDIR